MDSSPPKRADSKFKPLMTNSLQLPSPVSNLSTLNEDYQVKPNGIAAAQSLAKEKTRGIVDIYLDDVDKSKRAKSPNYQPATGRLSYRRSSSLNHEEEGDTDEMKATGVFNMVMQEDKRDSIRSKRSNRKDIIEEGSRGSMKRQRTNDKSSSLGRDKKSTSFKFKFWGRDKNQSSKKIDEKSNKKTEEETAKSSRLK